MLERALDLAVRYAAAPVQNSDQCCVFARLVLVGLYGESVVNRAPVSAWHLWDVARPWSPVEAAVQAGITLSATYAPAPPVPRVGALHQIQGWRGTPGAAGVTGHTWLWWATSATHGYQIDAAAAPYRMAPGVEVRLRRWADVIAPYQYGVAIAALRSV